LVSVSVGWIGFGLRTIVDSLLLWWLKTGDEPLIQITTARRMLLDSPAADEPSLLDPSDDGKIHRHMVKLHRVNKQLLCELPNDTMCKRIGLGE